MIIYFTPIIVSYCWHFYILEKVLYFERIFVNVKMLGCILAIIFQLIKLFWKNEFYES